MLQVNNISLREDSKPFIEDSSTSSCIESEYVKALRHCPPVSH